MNNTRSLSLEQEKYLCMLNRLDAISLIKLEKNKQIEIGLANVNSDFLKLIDYEKQLKMIDTVLQIRSLKN
tara:strand:- start:88 stop:300 length:213 start_codon:yes stop_codon:yes gene_type:complete